MKIYIDNLIQETKYFFRNIYYRYISQIIFPSHQRIRGKIPREWSDIASLIEVVNFEFIKSFYEDEYKTGLIDWNDTDQLKEFSKWLESAYKYLTIKRPELELKLDKSYPPLRPFDETFKKMVREDGSTVYTFVDDGVPYKVKYKETIRIEKLLDKKDTELLNGLIKYRKFFWT